MTDGRSGSVRRITVNDDGTVTFQLNGHANRYTVSWASTDDGPVVTSLRIFSGDGEVVVAGDVRRIPIDRLARCAARAVADPDFARWHSPPPSMLIPAVSAADVAAVSAGDVRAALLGLTGRQLEVLAAAAKVVPPIRDDHYFGPEGFFRPRDVAHGVAPVLMRLERRGLLECPPGSRANAVYRVSALGLAVVAAAG